MNTNTEDMEEAHYWHWEPSASSSLSLNPPENNRHRPSTQYALSSSLTKTKTKTTLRPKPLRFLISEDQNVQLQTGGAKPISRTRLEKINLEKFKDHDQ